MIQIDYIFQIISLIANIKWRKQIKIVLWETSSISFHQIGGKLLDNLLTILSTLLFQNLILNAHTEQPVALDERLVENEHFRWFSYIKSIVKKWCKPVPTTLHYYVFIFTSPHRAFSAKQNIATSIINVQRSPRVLRCTMILKTNVRLRGAPAKPLKKTEYIAEDGHVFRKIKTAETMQSPRQSYKFIMYVWDQSLVLNPHIAWQKK